MEHEHLRWTVESSSEAYRCRVFSVRDALCVAADGRKASFSVIDALDWAIVVPVLKDESGERFAMVRQWRHGSRELSLEFPGGVLEPGEDPAAGAARELLEETGWAARELRFLGSPSPNPAIMSNRVHIFAAEVSGPRKKQELDEDEYVDVELVQVEEAKRNVGKAPYGHALMATALALYCFGRA